MTPTGQKPLYERITPEHLATALDDIRAGTPKVVAFVCLGYSREAFHRSQQAGREAARLLEDDVKLTPRQIGALAFWLDLERAWAEAERTHIRTIGRASRGGPKAARSKDGVVTEFQPGQWQAAAWLLERSRPEYRLAVQAPVVVEPVQPAGPAPGTPEYEAAILAELVKHPQLLERAMALAKGKT